MEERIPKFCILTDLLKPLQSLLDGKIREPEYPKAVNAFFSEEPIKQEVSRDRFIQIQEQKRGIYRLWWPTPIYRAGTLKRALKTHVRGGTHTTHVGGKTNDV